MISFEQPELLLAAVPWLLFWGWLARAQESSLAELMRSVSERFRPQFSRYGTRSLRLHMAALLGLGVLAVVAAARPAVRGGVEAIEQRGRLLLLIDASASMYAGDVEALTPGAEAPGNRFDLARAIAFELVRRLEGFHFAVATYSGVATVNLPMSAEAGLVEETLRTLETHNYYRSTGSSLGRALDLAFHFTEEGRRELQVVVIGDGELPNDDDYDDTVRALADQEIPVHALTVGSTDGQRRIIYDFRDVAAGKPPDERRVLRRYHTRRIDEHLRGISRRTGGRFAVASADSVEALAGAIRDRPAASRRIESEAARTDVSFLPLALFLAGFVAHVLWLGTGRRRPAIAFEVDRIGGSRGAAPPRRGSPLAAAALLLPALAPLAAGCGQGPLERAHRENERGIALDALRRHEDARPHYERSIGYRLQPHVPTHNLARSLTLQERYSEAHDLFQDALLLAPELPEAHYNDGMALFRWGRAEMDPAGCQLQRTRELWQGAFGRFAAAAELAGRDPALQGDARANLEAVARALARVDALIASPPPHCLEEKPQTGKGGGVQPEDDPAGGGGAGEQDESQEEGEGSGGGAPPSEQDEEENESQESQEEGEGGGAPQDEPGEEDSGTGGPPPAGAAPLPASGGPEEHPTGGPPLTGEELERIRGELERIAARAGEEGKFHRRTRSEQFDKESWSDPDAVIWW